jgi:hypothetical protein
VIRLARTNLSFLFTRTTRARSVATPATLARVCLDRRSETQRFADSAAFVRTYFEQDKSSEQFIARERILLLACRSKAVTKHHCGDGCGVGWSSRGGVGYCGDLAEVAGAEDARSDHSKCASGGG